MKQLLLVRHAKSDWSDDTLIDFDRPLNSRGRHDAPLMAAFLVKRRVAPTYLYSSPANRAYSTARLFASHFGIAENDISTDHALYEAHTHQIVDAPTQLPDAHDTVAMFSHNPAITSAAAQFSEDFVPNIPTCGVALIEADVASWANFTPATASLKSLWFPKRVLDAYS